MRVRLRQLEEEDLPLLRDWRNDDELRMTFREYRLLNMINQHAWLARVSTSREVEMFGIEIGQAPGPWSLVGACGLSYIDWVNRTAEISIYINLKEHGREEIARETMKSLATKGFNEFNLQKLWAEVYSFNAFNIKLLEDCGFIREGELKQHAYKNGKYWTSYMYGLLKSSWCGA